MKKIFYLAHPYTGNKRKNVESSIQITNELMDLGYVIFNPLTHSHPLDMAQTRDPKFWYDLDILFLKRFDGIIMCPGWVRSEGCLNELRVAKDIIREGVLFKVDFYDAIINIKL